MLYREDEQFKLMPFVATYIQHGQEHIGYVVDKSEMEAYEELGHIKNLSFKEADFTDAQKERLEEVKEYPESAFSEVVEYVVEGTVPRGSMIEKDKELQAIRETVDTLIFDNLIGGLF